MELLDLNIIKSYINPLLNDLINIKIFNEINSTHLFLKSSKKNSTFTSVLAESQTNGIGRNSNKTWNSPFAENIYSSYVFQINKPQLKTINLLSFYLAKIIINIIESLNLKKIQFKWPNDILINGQKVAGILIELVKDENNFYVVASIGLNVSMHKIVELNNTSLMVAMKEQNLDTNLNYKNILAAQLIQNVFKLSNQDIFSTDILNELDKYNILNNFKNIPIRIHQSNKIIVGNYIKLNQDGALVMDISGVPTTFYSVDKLILN